MQSAVKRARIKLLADQTALFFLSSFLSSFTFVPTSATIRFKKYKTMIHVYDFLTTTQTIKLILLQSAMQCNADSAWQLVKCIVREGLQDMFLNLNHFCNLTDLYLRS